MLYSVRSTADMLVVVAPEDGLLVLRYIFSSGGDLEYERVCDGRDGAPV